MKITNIFEMLRDLLFPPKCLLCSSATASGKSELCNDCLRRWQRLIDVKCQRCGKIAAKCNCNFRCLDDVKYIGALFFYDYEDSMLADGKQLIYSLKRGRDRRVARFIAREMAAMLLKYAVSNGIDINCTPVMVTNAPRSREAVKEYGFDHGEELARHIARYIGVQYESLFANKKGTVQKNLSAAERKDNAEHSIQLRGSITPGTLYILIDDVITTGATLGRCAALLHDRGAENVICATVASTKSKIMRQQLPRSDSELWFKN